MADDLDIPFGGTLHDGKTGIERRCDVTELVMNEVENIYLDVEQISPDHDGKILAKTDANLVILLTEHAAADADVIFFPGDGVLAVYGPLDVHLHPRSQWAVVLESARFIRNNGEIHFRVEGGAVRIEIMRLPVMV